MYCLVVYFLTDQGNDIFQLPLPVWYVHRFFAFSIFFCYEILPVCLFRRFPFNTKTLIGYLIAVTIEFILAIHGFFIMANVSTFGMAAYFFTVAAIKDIERNLIKFNECTRLKRVNFSKTIKNHTNTKKTLGKTKSNNIRTRIENQMKLLNFLSNFIQLHSNTVQLSTMLKPEVFENSYSKFLLLFLD